MVTKKKQASSSKEILTKSELLEKVRELFDKYLDTTGAIIEEDFVVLDGTKTELKAADENLLNELEKLENDNDDLGIDEVLQFIDDNINDLDITEKVLNALDEQDVIDFTCKDGSHIFIKVEGIVDRDKLEEFVRNNIYPYNCNPDQELSF